MKTARSTAMNTTEVSHEYLIAEVKRQKGAFMLAYYKRSKRKLKRNQIPKLRIGYYCLSSTISVGKAGAPTTRTGEGMVWLLDLKHAESHGNAVAYRSVGEECLISLQVAGIEYVSSANAPLFSMVQALR